MNIILCINFFGGLALFLYALKIMNDNLQAVAGNRMKNILKKLTDTPLKGVLVGVAVTGIIQSSSATSVMVIGLVNAGIMSLAQAIGVIMGTNIGTTVTAQIIAFNLGNYAYILVITGIIMMFIRSSKAMERWSYIIFGFGLLFVTLKLMSDSVIPLRESEMALNYLQQVYSKPLLALLAGAVFTMIIQSSSASVGIILVLATSQLIDLEGALYLIFGCNIGTTITAWLAAINVSRAAKQVALVHTLFNLIGAIIFTILTYIGLFTRFLDFVTPGDINNMSNLPRYIANAHTYFNIISCLIFLPFTGVLAKIASFVIRNENKEVFTYGDPKHLDVNLIKSPEIAINQAIKEMQEMLRLSKKSLLTSMELFSTRNYRDQEKITKIENAIDNLQKEITLYLIKLNERTSSRLIVQKIPALLHTINDIERIGDYAEHINEILNTQILSESADFNADFMKIINHKHERILYMIDLCISYLDSFDAKNQKKIFDIEKSLSSKHKELRLEILQMIRTSGCIAMEGLHTIDYIDAIDSLALKIKNIVVAGSHGFMYK